MNKVKEIHSGFILPTVLALSLAIVTIMVTLLMVTSSSFGGTYIDHYQKLADEAAEAGAAYATACLSLSTHVQTWGPAASKPDLSPNTDCAGANTYSSNMYVYSDSTIRTYFVVSDLDYSVQFSAQISSRGYTELLKPNGTVDKTYTSIQKKIITWPTDISGQMSASGTNRTCAIVNSSAYCWGYNGFGQLGNGQYVGGSASILDDPSSVDSTVPVKVLQQPGVMAGKKIVKIFAAQYHSCALSDDGLMYCWGYNANGQLGTGNGTDSPVPVQVGGALAGKTITDIGGTSNTSCAIAAGKIYCWGYNSKGQVGKNTVGGTINSPVLVVAGNTSTTLATSYTATALSTSGSRSQTMCAVADAKAYCWGANDIGSVGDNTSGAGNTRNLPTKAIDTGVLSGKTVTSISQDGYVSSGSGGFAHVCAVASGAVYCWGDNTNGQIGDNTTTDRSQPVTVIASGVLNGKTIQEVQVGLRHSCVRANGGAYCWGLNTSGQVGDASNTQRNTPVAVAQQAGGLTASNVISIGAGANRGCAIVTDGRTFCWGLNTSGQVGDGTKINRNVPTESLFLRPVGNQYIF
ncbi:MAG: RCC1 domain-containing protein [Candidatus Saccharimonadaceae bacterium]